MKTASTNTPRTQEPQLPAGRRYRTLVRWILAIILLSGIVLFLKHRTRDLQTVGKVDLRYLAAVAGMLTCVLVTQTTRTFLVLRRFSGLPIPFSQWLRLYIYGQFLNLFVMQMGNLSRTIALKAKWGLPYTHYAGSALLFVWLDTALNCLVATIVLLTVAPELHLWQVPAYVVLIILLAIWISLPIAALLGLRRHGPTARPPGKVRQRLLAVAESCSRVLLDSRTLATFVLTGLLSLSFMVVAFRLAFLAFDTAVPTVSLIVLHVFDKLSYLVIITPGNLGVREIMTTIVCQGMGIPVALAMLASLVMRVGYYAAVGGTCAVLAGIDGAKAAKTRLGWP